MSNVRNGHSTAVALFAAAVITGLLAVTVMTFDWGDTRIASNETPPGATGLARAPLDRARSAAGQLSDPGGNTAPAAPQRRLGD